MLTAAEMRGCFEGKAGMTIEQTLAAIQDRTGGVVRISLGLATTFADVHTFLRFARTFVDRPARDAP